MAQGEFGLSGGSDERAPPCLASPIISLVGQLNDQSARSVIEQIRKAADGGGDVAMEVTTLGGDAEMARRIVLDLDRARSQMGSRRLSFVGKTVVYSAGVTIMSAFSSAERWLTPDAILLIHCRQLDKTVEVSGPMRASLAEVEALAAQIRTGLALEDENFRRLAEGSDIGVDELCGRAIHNWYMTAQEAVDRRLVAGLA
ncbi:ATP-dependent Clp protease proteolytic subunit [Sphingosinicella sp. CPCC 101087]|uniref:ATP-dependent Clp protease proteolytic subunit n=1 Tax=Sphingosinicella sp. CPCC 101087 TaxID=2497754 RepID=UPI00101D18C3|nr:ATP-dependent Clp protease proteolytic subunit [Sphingosinicella sp. CPCC 101087]